MSDKLVSMEKAGEKPIKVHPLCVEDHKGLGWNVVGETTAEEAAPAESPADSTPRRSRSRKSKPAEADK
jgi:hypothetical protein